MKNIKIETTKYKIHQAFFSLATRYPAHKINVSKICETCSISRGTFYLHYDNIQDLLTSTEQEILYNFEKLFKKYSKLAFHDEKNQLLLDMLEYTRHKQVELCYFMHLPSPSSFLPRLTLLIQTGIQNHLSYLGISQQDNSLALTFACAGLLHILNQTAHGNGPQDYASVCEEYNQLMETMFLHL